jgi:hypothetical protein
MDLQFICVVNLFSSLMSRMRARMPAATAVHLRSEQQVAGFTPLLSTPTLIGGALFSSRSLFKSSYLVMQASDGHDKKTNNGSADRRRHERFPHPSRLSC